jgi:hypothetical protein
VKGINVGVKRYTVKLFDLEFEMFDLEFEIMESGGVRVYVKG